MSGPLRDFEALAYNAATDSDNRIHSDDVARRHGFRGGLVPGVTVYAYLVHPAVAAWGRDWLADGRASIELRRPLYDGERFAVRLADPGEDPTHDAMAYDACVQNAAGEPCAPGRASLGAGSERPARRGDPPVGAPEKRPQASRDALERLAEQGLGAVHGTWRIPGYFDTYTRAASDHPELLRADGAGFANPAYLLGLANGVLAANVRLGPWIHVQSEVRHFAAVEPETGLATEARVVDLFDKRGHEFVDLDVNVFAGDRPVLTAHHRAIYRLRGEA